MSPRQIAERLTRTPFPRSEAALRKLLDDLPVGAYTCDAAGRITYFNQHAVQLWGRSPKLNDDHDRYCGSFRLYSTAGVPISHDRCWMALAIRDGRTYNGREIVVERPDGRRVTALAYASPLCDSDGELHGGVKLLVAVTADSNGQHASHSSERYHERLPDSCAYEFVARPPRDGPTAHNAGSRDRPACAAARALRILVVDDNIDSAETMAALLEMQGHETRTAHDGLEALDELEGFEPDVVILDIGMPRMNGYAAAMRIRERMTGVQPLLIALTGWGQPEDRDRSKAAGFDHHLVKPVDPVLLFELLSSSSERTLH